MGLQNIKLVGAAEFTSPKIIRAIEVTLANRDNRVWIANQSSLAYQVSSARWVAENSVKTKRTLRKVRASQVNGSDAVRTSAVFNNAA